ncbi:MAG: hypothetical protein M1816_004226 [Peltula sp. TS41687]|nr:MAG: hypothetical protein M1816_004226 [Peltula sp. TS41687]
MSPDMATTAGVSIAKGHWQSDGVYYFVGADGLTIFDNGKIPTVAAVTTMTTTVEVEPLPRTVVGSRHVGGPPVKSTRTTYTTTTTTVWRAVTPPSPSPTSEAPPSFMTLYVTGPPTTITERFKFAVSQTATTDPDSGSTSTTTTTLFVDGPPTTITRTSTVGNLTVAWATPHPLF